MSKKYKLKTWYPTLPIWFEVGFEVIKNNELCCYGNPKYKMRQLSIDEVEYSDKFWELIKEKEFEIIQQELNIKAAFPYDGFTIKSIRRLSDNEVFSIGDKVDNFYNTIIGFEEDDKLGLRVRLKRSDGAGTCGLLLGSVKKATPKALFITEDGVEIFDGDNFYLVGKEFVLKYWDFKTHDYYNNILYLKNKLKFSTEKAAKDYIEMNKPQYSMKDILNASNELPNPNGYSSSVRIININKLK